MIKITTTQKISTVALILLVVVIAGYVLFYTYIDSLHQELHDVRAKVDVMDQFAEDKQDAVKLLESTQEDRRELAGYFVSLEDPTPFINLIDSIAKDANIFLDNDKTVLDSGGAPFKGSAESKDIENEVSMTIVIRGAWDEIYHFLTLLEHLPYVTTITKVIVTEDEKSEISGEWKGQIHLSVNRL